MKRLFMFALIVTGLISLGGISSIAGTSQNTSSATKQVAAISKDVMGKVTDIESDSNTLKIADEAGKTHAFKVSDPKLLEGLQVGDMVKVTLEKGKATSIEKVEATAPDEGNTESAPAQ